MIIGVLYYIFWFFLEIFRLQSSWCNLNYTKSSDCDWHHMFVEAPMSVETSFDATASPLKGKWSVDGCCRIKDIFFRLRWTWQVKMMSREGKGKEVWMQQCLHKESKHSGCFRCDKNFWCRNALAFRVNQHFFQQWRSFERCFRHQLFDWLASHIGKCDFVVVGKRCHFLIWMRNNSRRERSRGVMSEWFKLNRSYRPESMRGGTQSSQHTNQLIDIILAAEQWRVVDELSEDATLFNAWKVQINDCSISHQPLPTYPPQYHILVHRRAAQVRGTILEMRRVVALDAITS